MHSHPKKDDRTGRRGRGPHDEANRGRAGGLRPLDVVAVVVGIAVAVASVFPAYRGGEGALVHIQAASGEFLYPLSTDETIVLKGPIGDTIVEVVDRRVRVAKDPGPRQICVKKGWIDRSGEWLACLPNQVLITIEGDDDGSQLDGLAY